MIAKERKNYVYFIALSNLSGPIRRRLHDLGLIEGTKVRCLYKSAWQDPVAYSIRSTVIALRNVDTRSIFVRPNPGCGR